MESNRDIPDKRSTAICIMVIPKYIMYSILAESPSLGTSLPTSGPGDSDLIRCMFCAPVMGSTASMKTKTPIPPIQWVKLLQKRELCDRCSTSCNMLEPVVVNPETVSKKASVKLGISPVI